jgi:hypothetical protein
MMRTSEGLPKYNMLEVSIRSKVNAATHHQVELRSAFKPAAAPMYVDRSQRLTQTPTQTPTFYQGSRTPEAALVDWAILP